MSHSGSSWYTCMHDNYTAGQTSCLYINNCKPMNIFLGALAAFGFISNLLVFILIWIDKNLNNPIYIGIQLLSIPDSIVLSIRFLWIAIPSIDYKSRDTSRLLAVSVVVMAIYLTSCVSSAAHVLLLAVQQYLLIAHPIKSRLWITRRKTVISSMVLWTITAIIMVPYIYLIYVNHDYKIETSIFNDVYTAIYYVVPIAILLTLHVLKTKALRSSLLNRDAALKRVSRMISLVILSYVITTAPTNVKGVLELSYCTMIDEWYIVFGHIGNILLFLNYTINPYIYFLSTPQFRHALIICCRFSYRNNNSMLYK
ncbi:adrenocorticotropic hormone receptor-like [Mytilus edulis]|uniref:adrenocorticotropic hormone receptor-like n=1 Tax=Mytilus edulis TaxID=6550 RepID=UPI0039EF5CAA